MDRNPEGHTRVFKTPLGWVGILVTQHGLRQLICPQGQRQEVEKQFEPSGLRTPPGSNHPKIEKILAQAQQQITAYCEGRKRIFQLPLDLHQGTEFQRRVWHQALKIPYGRTQSYLWIAKALGGRGFSRAVGSALGANPLPLIIPCHRVLTSSGALGGYSGGLPVKIALLALEGLRV